MRYDTVIAGAGLAGACAALWLSRTHRVCVLERERPGTGASRAAAGLVNPFMGRKANRSWRADEALDALDATLAAAGAEGLFHASGVLRPAGSAQQTEAFRATAEAHADRAAWLSSEAVGEQWPDVSAPHGVLEVLEGGHIALSDLVAALLQAAKANGAEVRTGVGLSTWEKESNAIIAITDAKERISAGRLVLALGDGFRHFRSLDALPLHRIKGQTVVLARPPHLPADLPALAGGIYIVPAADGFVVGATFEHAFDSLHPTPEAGTALRTKAAQVLPALAEADVLAVRAGVRVTVPGVRLPLLGPLLGMPRVWVFTGLGAKGLLTAPLLARGLARCFDDPEAIPAKVSTLRLRTRPA